MKKFGAKKDICLAKVRIGLSLILISVKCEMISTLREIPDGVTYVKKVIMKGFAVIGFGFE
jgi:hypothetical protein